MARRLLFSILLSTLLCTTAAAQSYKYLYYFDNNLVSTTEAKAVFIAKGMIDKDGLVRVDYFFKQGHAVLMSIHFTDSTLKTMSGSFRSFYLNGKLENRGWYTNGVENGTWIKWDSTGNITDSAVYNNGIRNSHATYSYDNKGKLFAYEFLDSINDKYRYISYDGKRIQTDAEYSGKEGLVKMYDSNGVVTTRPIYSRERTEASFSGGDDAFRKYIGESLNANTPVTNGAPEGTYMVIIRFIVQKDGTISHVSPETHFGYGMEEEVVRIIKNSPSWKPAKLFGEPVLAYRRQPVTFVVQQK